MNNFYQAYSPTAQGIHGANDNWASPFHGTTILCVRKNGKVVMAGDGQVTFGNTILKGNATKVRPLGRGKTATDRVIAGFAGATADAFTLFERLEAKLEKHPNQLMRACVELAKDWRTDKYLRKLEAMMTVANREVSLLLAGNGDVVAPEGDVIGIGSGGSFALAAATVLMDEADLSAETVARRAMKVAGDICLYTNHHLTLEEIEL